MVMLSYFPRSLSLVHHRVLRHRFSCRVWAKGVSLCDRHKYLFQRNCKKSTLASSEKEQDIISAQQEAWDEAICEMESEKLYGLSTKESELSQVASWLDQGRLNLFPEYQRDYVWKSGTASRLIATVLCNRYIPPIVLHEKEKGKYDVIDGKERLTTILAWYLHRNDATRPTSTISMQLTNKIPSLNVLSKLDESYERLNGLSFDALTESRKRSFDCYTITYAVVPHLTPKSDVFEVYEDINSGGQNLNPQQIRRAVFYGPYIRLLDEIAETCFDFHAIKHPDSFNKNTYATSTDHSDRELILRAFAFHHKGSKFKSPLKKFLNQELDGTEEFDAKDEKDKLRIMNMLEDYKNEFKDVMDVARRVFGDKAFRYVFSKNKDVSAPFWDSGYSALAELLTHDGLKRAQFVQAKDAIVERLEKAMLAGEFESVKSMSKNNFMERKRKIQDIIRKAILQNAPRDSQRAFARTLVKPLFDEQKGKCHVCNQSIDEGRLGDGSYVHIDHIVPHSKGGKTVTSNAQLVHRECNLQKSDRL